VTLAELLAVIALMGILVAVAVPLVAEQVRQAKIRGAADEYASTLKAARMLAVSKRAPQSVTVNVHPTNTYAYVDTRERDRTFRMPDGVRIVSSTDPITFQINGSLTAAATTVIEASLNDGVIERWTVTTGIAGVPNVVRERIEP
jgi:Tfp pilus assembly protein FimT